MRSTKISQSAGEAQYEPVATGSGAEYGGAVAAQVERAAAEKQRVPRNAAANWVGFAVRAVFAFFMSPLLVHGLGDARYGLWALVGSVIGYLSLAELGIGAAVLRFVAKFEGAGEHEQVNRVFSASLVVFLLGGMGVLVGSCGLAFLWPRPLGVSSDLVSDARWLLVFLGVNLALVLTLGIYETVLSALRRYGVKTAIRVAGVLVGNALFLVVLWRGWGIPGIVLTITGSSLLTGVIAAWAAHRYLPTLRFSPRLVNRRVVRMIFGYSSFVFIAFLAGRVAFQSDAIVIAAFLPPQYITFYAIAWRVLALGRESIVSLTMVLTPTVSNLEGLEDFAGIRTILSQGTRFVFYLSLPIQIGGLLFGYDFLALWMGPRYADASYPVLAILLIPLPLALAGHVAIRVLHGLGRVRLFSLIALGQAMANILLSVVLVWWLGTIEGCAIGTAIPWTLYAVAVTWLACRALGVSTWRHLISSLRGPMAATIVLLALWEWVRYYVLVASWISFGAVSLLGLAVYGAVALALEWNELRLLRCRRAPDSLLEARG